VGRRCQKVGVFGHLLKEYGLPKGVVGVQVQMRDTLHAESGVEVIVRHGQASTWGGGH
jgi:hypothetical protein